MKEKQNKFGNCVLWTVLCYVVISVIAGVCSVIRGMVPGAEGNGISWFVVVEFVLFPVLFYVAGYFGSKKGGWERFKSGKVWLFSFVFSAVLLVLWYVLLELYVVFNLPVAEGSLVLDLFLRKITVVQEYAVKYLRETNVYRYGILPGIHFVFRILYWLLYMLGNRKYASAQKENRV